MSGTTIFGIDTTRNFSLYTIPAAWLLCLLPHAYATSLHDSASPKKADNRNPRALVTSLSSNQSIPQATKDKIVRAEAAQANGFENIGLFAAAVVAGNAAGVDNWWLNMLSVGYVGSRVVYNIVYIGNSTKRLANVRTGTFLSGIGMVMSLFVMAGNRVRNTPFSK
jgi:uncharacterized MAPEG superfamily protein